MDLAIKIASLIALIAFAVLCVRLMFSAAKLSKVMYHADILIKDISAYIPALQQKIDASFLLFNEMKLKLDEVASGIEEIKIKSIDTLKHADEALIQGKITAQSLEVEIAKISQTIQPYRLIADKIYEKLQAPVSRLSSFISSSSKTASNLFFSPIKKLRGLFE